MIQQIAWQQQYAMRTHQDLRLNFKLQVRRHYFFRSKEVVRKFEEVVCQLNIVWRGNVFIRDKAKENKKRVWGISKRN